MIIYERDFTIEELVEKSRQQTTQTVPTEGGALKFTGLEKNECSSTQTCLPKDDCPAVVQLWDDFKIYGCL